MGFVFLDQSGGKKRRGDITLDTQSTKKHSKDVDFLVQIDDSHKKRDLAAMHSIEVCVGFVCVVCLLVSHSVRFIFWVAPLSLFFWVGYFSRCIFSIFPRGERQEEESTMRAGWLPAFTAPTCSRPAGSTRWPPSCRSSRRRRPPSRRPPSSPPRRGRGRRRDRPAPSTARCA